MGEKKKEFMGWLHGGSTKTKMNLVVFFIVTLVLLLIIAMTYKQIKLHSESDWEAFIASIDALLGWFTSYLLFSAAILGVNITGNLASKISPMGKVYAAKKAKDLDCAEELKVIEGKPLEEKK